MNRKDILERFLREIWSEGKVEAVDRYVGDFYTIHHDPGDPWDGQTLTRDGFRDRLITSRAAAPDQVFTVVRMLEESTSVAVTWKWAGTHLGDLPGIPATGRAITMSGATVYDFDGPLLTGHWQIADRLGVYRQLMTGAD